MERPPPESGAGADPRPGMPVSKHRRAEGRRYIRRNAAAQAPGDAQAASECRANGYNKWSFSTKSKNTLLLRFGIGYTALALS